MANRYWVTGGSAQWKDGDINNWAEVSGGPSGFSVPTAADDVFFDANSGTGEVTVDGASVAKSINFTGFTGSFKINASLTISGNLTLSSQMTIYFNTITFLRFNASATLTSNGTQITTLNDSAQIDTSGSGTTLTLGDDINFAGTLLLNTQTNFTANDKNVTLGRFQCSSSATSQTVTMGSGLWTIKGLPSSVSGSTWDVRAAGTTLNKNTANIYFDPQVGNSSPAVFNSTKTYNKITVGNTTNSVEIQFSASPTFSEIDSNRTGAWSLSVQSGTTLTTSLWKIKGSAGNLVTIDSSSTTSSGIIALAGGGYTENIDYLFLRNIIFSPISDTWYVGENTTFVNNLNANRTYGMFLTQRNKNAVIVLTSTTANTSWTIPSDWVNDNNTIHLIGGGGGGAGSRSLSNNRAGGGGGGGGGYTKLVNQYYTNTPIITYSAGTAGASGSANANGGSGGTTTWTVNGVSYTAGGGGGGAASSTPSSTGGTAGTGSTYSGGTGGAGSTATVSTSGCGGGGGAGAGGPFGNGGNGGNGFSSLTAANIAGGGGGGNGGGTNGGNASSANGGNGGNNAAGIGGGTSANNPGWQGGGGKGSTGSDTPGGNGTDILGVGGGGGGGGEDDTARSCVGGRYGGGGGGAGVSTTGTIFTGSSGFQGVVIVVYSFQNSGFFLLF